VKDQLRAARLPVAVQNAILGQVDGARWVWATASATRWACCSRRCRIDCPSWT